MSEVHPEDFTALVAHNGVGPCAIWPVTVGERIPVDNEFQLAPYLAATSAFVEEQSQELEIPFSVIPPGVHRIEATPSGEEPPS